MIPAFNEERRLPALLVALARTAEGDMAAAGLHMFEAVVVDDGSTDGSAAFLRKADHAHPFLKGIIYEGPNLGKGHAVRLGVAAAKGGAHSPDRRGSRCASR